MVSEEEHHHRPIERPQLADEGLERVVRLVDAGDVLVELGVVHPREVIRRVARAVRGGNGACGVRAVVLHRDVEHELRVVGALEHLEDLVVGGRVAHVAVVGVGALERVDVVEGVEAHLLVDERAVPVAREVGVDGGRLVSEVLEGARHALHVREAHLRVGVLVLTDVVEVHARERLELGVAGASAEDRDVAVALRDGVGEAGVEESRALIACVSDVLVDGEVRVRLVHDDDDRGLFLVELALRLRARLVRPLVVCGGELGLVLLGRLGAVPLGDGNLEGLELLDEARPEALLGRGGHGVPVVEVHAEVGAVLGDGHEAAERDQADHGGEGAAQRASVQEGDVRAGRRHGEDVRGAGDADARVADGLDHGGVNLVDVRAAHLGGGAERQEVGGCDRRPLEEEHEVVCDADEEHGDDADGDAHTVPLPHEVEGDEEQPHDHGLYGHVLEGDGAVARVPGHLDGEPGKLHAEREKHDGREDVQPACVVPGLRPSRMPLPALSLGGSGDEGGARPRDAVAGERERGGGDDCHAGAGEFILPAGVEPVRAPQVEKRERGHEGKRPEDRRRGHVAQRRGGPVLVEGARTQPAVGDDVDEDDRQEGEKPHGDGGTVKVRLVGSLHGWLPRATVQTLQFYPPPDFGYVRLLLSDASRRRGSRP